MARKTAKTAAAPGKRTREPDTVRVEAYLAACPEPHQTSLRKVRGVILAAAPDAIEIIHYQMPAIHQGVGVICYAAFKNHCSLFPMSARTRRDFSDELAGYPGGAGTIQFPPDKPPPAALIRKIVKARLAEIALRVAARKAKKTPPKKPAK